MIDGSLAMNRAIHGDTCYVQLLPFEEWPKTSAIKVAGSLTVNTAIETRVIDNPVTEEQKAKEMEELKIAQAEEAEIRKQNDAGNIPDIKDLMKASEERKVEAKKKDEE